jgi:hypothetical protein
VFTPEDFGRLLAGSRPFYRDHFIVQVSTGLRCGELLGLHAYRVNLPLRRIEVVDVRPVWITFNSRVRTTCGTPSPPGWRTPASRIGSSTS